MVNTNCAAADFRPVEVVHGQDCWSLVLIGDEAEAETFARRFVSLESQVHYFAKLAKNYRNITFIHLVAETSYKDVCWVAILPVPTCLWPGKFFKFLVSYTLDMLYFIHFYTKNSILFAGWSFSRTATLPAARPFRLFLFFRTFPSIFP